MYASLLSQHRSPACCHLLPQVVQVAMWNHPERSPQAQAVLEWFRLRDRQGPVYPNELRKKINTITQGE